MIVMTDRVVDEHLVLYISRSDTLKFVTMKRVAKNARVLMFDLNKGESINSIAKVAEKISLATLRNLSKSTFLPIQF